MNNKTPVISIRQAVDTIKSAILQSQARAAQAVNQEQLALYYGIGRYVSANSREGYWGTGAKNTGTGNLIYSHCNEKYERID